MARIVQTSLTLRRQRFDHIMKDCVPCECHSNKKILLFPSTALTDVFITETVCFPCSMNSIFVWNLHYFYASEVFPWSRRLVCGISRHAFDPRPVHVGFVVYKVAAWYVFLQLLRLSHLSIIPTVLHSSLYIHVVRTRRTNGPNLVTFKRNNAVWWEGEENLMEKCFHLFSLTFKLLIDIVM